MEFFSYFREMNKVAFPIQIFQVSHIIIIGIVFFTVYRLMSYYTTLPRVKQIRFQRQMGIYFFIEEVLYTIWLLWRCKENVWQEVLPLQLCSICAILAVLCVKLKKVDLRFFCGTIGLFAGSIAILYPANIAELYSIVSYRCINFFVLHGAFILFGLIQLKEEGIAVYKNIINCTFFLSVLTIVIFGLNQILHTDYMFIGVPSSIGFINDIYQGTGIFCFLLIVCIVFILIQYLVLFLYHFFVKCHKKNV